MTHLRLNSCCLMLALLTVSYWAVGTPEVDAQTAVLVPALPPIFPEEEAPDALTGERLASIRSLEADLPFPQLRSDPSPVAVDAEASSRMQLGRKGTSRLPTVMGIEQAPPVEPLRVAQRETKTQRETKPQRDPPKNPTVTPAEQTDSKGSLRPFPEEKPIHEIGISLKAPEGTLPRNLAQDRFLTQIDPWDRRPWGQIAYCWDAPVMSYHPLYYQDINLERHGYAFHPCLRPVVSGAHFFASTIALPYNATMHPPWEHVYPLGQYRPGSYVPAHVHWPQWDPKAAAAQGGVVAGAILLIP